MAFRVELTRRAREDVTEIFEYLEARSPDAAARWYLGLFAKLSTLENQPLRCARAPESDIVGREVRQLFYGRRPRDWFRALFDIEGDDIRVLRIRRCTRAELAGREVDAKDVDP